MTAQAENLIRSILASDGSAPRERVERAILVMKGAPADNSDLVRVIRYAEAAKMLGVHRRSIDYFIRKGYLTRVAGGGRLGIGITSESYQNFVYRRVVRSEPGGSTSSPK